MQTAAFTRIKEDFYAYFVPLRLLWRYFPTAINKLYKQVPFASSLTSINTLVDGKLPYVSLAELVSCVNDGSKKYDVVGLQRNYQSAKLLNYLGYLYVPDEYCRLVSTGKTPANPFVDNLKVSPFPLLAYQKIYQDFFRFTQWENMNSSSYNVDYVGDSGNSKSHYNIMSGLTPTDCAKLTDTGFLAMRYNNWRKDVFTGVLPSSQFGDVSLLTGDVESNVSEGALTGSFNFPESRVKTSSNDSELFTSIFDDTHMNLRYRANERSTDGDPLVVPSVTGDVSVPFSKEQISDARLKAQLSILDLRKALATQKLREITQAHDLTIKDQQNAHWGVTLPDTLSGECSFIGNVTSDIDINEVVNQNLYGSDNNGRATISGKGTGFDDSRLGTYEAKEFGIVMVLYTATPLLDYEAIGTDMQLVKTNVDDFPIPEYDKLGLDTIPSYWLSNSEQVGTRSKSIGWLPRYIDFKASIDLVRGEFMQTLKSWVAPVSRDIIKNTYFNPQASSWRAFKVNPSVLNPIFGMNVADGTESDQFYVNAYFDVKVQRNLDYSGMPY